MSILSRRIRRTLREIGGEKQPYYDIILDFIAEKWHELLIKCRYYDVKTFINNVPFFVKQAWEWREFDHYYSLEVYCNLLERLGKEIKETDRHTTAVKIQRECLIAARKLRSAYNRSVCDDKSYRYWSDNNPTQFVSSGNSGFSMITRKYKISKEYSEKMFKIINARVEKSIEQDKKEAWEYVHKHCERWWD